MWKIFLMPVPIEKFSSKIFIFIEGILTKEFHDTPMKISCFLSNLQLHLSSSSLRSSKSNSGAYGCHSAYYTKLQNSHFNSALQDYTLRLCSTPAIRVGVVVSMGGDVAKKHPTENNGTNDNYLPVSLAFLTDKDRNKFHSAMEVDANPKSLAYGQSFLCVQSVLVPNEEGVDTPYDLKSLFTLPLQTLCKNLGITNCGSKNKFDL
jgi:hypothetical protein